MFLAFARSTDEQGRFKANSNGVPMIACVTFMPTGLGSRFFFGSNFNVGPRSDIDSEDLRNSRQVLLDSWRKKVMNSILTANSLSPESSQPLGVGPILAEALAKELWALLRSHTAVSEEMQKAFAEISNSFLDTWMIQPPPALTPIPLYDIASMESEKKSLILDLAPVVEHRLGPENYVRDGVVLRQVVLPFFKRYLTPRMVCTPLPESHGAPQYSLAMANEVIPPPNLRHIFDTTRDRILGDFWTIVQNNLLDVLDDFRDKWKSNQYPMSCQI